MSLADTTNGYSANVAGYLKSNGSKYELARLAVDSLLLKDSAPIPSGVAELVVKVDDVERVQHIEVLPTRGSKSRVVKFVRPKTRILFIGADPLDQTHAIGYGKEYKAIEASKSKATLASQFDLVHCFATTPNKLLEYLTVHQPHVLHFGCHGTLANELVLEDQQQNSHYAAQEALKAVLSAQPKLKMVIFNACDSNKVAASIVDEIEIAIGMNDSILDRAAIIFAREFYHRIQCGFDVKNSFNHAQGALSLHNTGQEQLPELFTKNGVDAKKVVFASATNKAELYLGGLPKEEIVCRIKSRKDMLATWPRTVGNDKWIEREELTRIRELIENEEHSTTLLLGAKGTGKSALLSQLAHKLLPTETLAITIKAEFVPKSVATPEQLSEWIVGTSCDPVELIQYLATGQKVVLIVDQLDAIAELMDRESNRLNVLLDTIKKLHRRPNVHIVASCREFEFRHDVRLTTLAAEEVRLKAPSWDSVAEVLREEGFQTDKITTSLKKLLETPWHLKMFLEVASVDSVYSNLHGLIQAVWDKIVLNTDGPSGRDELTKSLAQRISSEEQLWVDARAFDDKKEARDYLVAADVLVYGDQNKVIGFRHQTYYDFVLASAMGGELNLVDHALDKQQSLFVRPSLISALNWVRDVDRPRYHEQIKGLFEAEFRLHLKTLLIEFVGNLSEPDEVEAELLLPLLDDPSWGKRMLSSVAFSSGWYGLLILDERFEKWLNRDVDDTAWCIRPLQTGIRVDRDGVLTALRQHWFGDPAKDGLTAAVLKELTAWDDGSIKMIEAIAARTKIYSLGMIAHDIAEKHPRKVPAIVRAAIERQGLEPKQHSYSDSIDELIKACDFYELDGLAEDAPRAFLNELLPWYDNYIGGNTYRGSHRNHLKRDRVSRLRFDDQLPDDELSRSLCIASGKLAEQKPARFCAVLNRHKDSEMMSTHMVLSCGLMKLSSSDPKAVLEYLIGDDRRLMVERGMNDFGFTSMLIAELCPHLKAAQLKTLEDKLLAYKGYSEDFLKSEPASSRKTFYRFGREYRLRLLNSIPDKCITKGAQKIRDEDRLQLCDSRTEHLHWEGGCIGSRMTVEEILKASPDDLFNLINRLAEHESQGGRDWDNRLPASRAGGMEELCRELEKAISQEPEKSEPLFERFSSPLHDRAFAAVVRGLSDSEMPTEDLYDRLGKLNGEAGDGTEYREAFAHALNKRVSKEHPLPDAFWSTLFDWCMTTPSPNYQNSADECSDDAIVFHRHGPLLMLTNERGALLRCFVKCYSVEDPLQPDRLRNLLSDLIKIENHPEVMAEVMYNFKNLFAHDEELATELYDQAIKSCPNVLLQTFALFAIGSFIHLVRPIERLDTWLALLSKEVSEKAQQIYGELLFLIFQRTLDSKYESLIRQQLDGDSIPVIRGLGHGASYFWHSPHCRALATDVLVNLTSIDDEKSLKPIEHALLSSQDDSFRVDRYSKSFIDSILANPKLVTQLCDHLAEIAEEFVVSLPEFALQLTSRIVEEIESNPDKQYRIAPESVTNVAITLHRRPATRQKGLELFEQILALNLPITRTAIDLLDRQPNSRFRHFFSRRRRPRRRRN